MAVLLTLNPVTYHQQFSLKFTIHCEAMEKKEGFLFFFGALSVFSTLLVICLACLVIHNNTQVENIRIKLTALEKSCSCLQQPTTRDQDVVEVPQDRTTIDLTQGERLKRDSDRPRDVDSTQELYVMISHIVEQQLQETLDCSNNETECILKPGPKGDQGEPGPRGKRGRRGKKGNQGDIGALGQVNCTWVYTDTCGHHCGAGSSYTAICPLGKYVAGFGVNTWNAAARYHTRVYCCTPS